MRKAKYIQLYKLVSEQPSKGDLSFLLKRKELFTSIIKDNYV